MNLVVKVLLYASFVSVFHWYTFPSFRTQIPHPLVHGVRISSKASMTAEYVQYNTTAAVFLQMSLLLVCLLP